MPRRFFCRIALVSFCAAGLLSACSTPKPMPVTTLAKSCADFSFPIYFEKGADDLTGPARAVLMDAAGQAKGCVVRRVEVVGLADADGPARRNLALSRRRAAIVAKALIGAGLPGPDFDIEALGEAGAKAVDGAPNPMRRRTEVVIHIGAAPPADHR